ncbi:MAG TPA: hypothetical protein VHI98_12910 [Vicinamibacterales bacterium]|jgi:hypothetical protein|nr:hypothetical protein [Vicinamibacterales bacterium]
MMLRFAFLLTLSAAMVAGGVSPNDGFAVADLDREVRSFLDREVAAHLAAVTSLDPPVERVHGALTTGEYTWGTFMRALAAYAQLSGAANLEGRDLGRTIADIGLVEARFGGTRFSQLYAALSLRHFGTDLAANRVWQSLTPAERKTWTRLLDVTQFYDPVRRQPINLPENYLGVAARIAAIAWEVKLLDDRALLDALLDRAAQQFTAGALYADDAVPAGRYDRYSNEYARYVWEAAQIAGRRDLLDALRPSLRAQMRLWWDLVSPDGYGYTWGRSVGAISYMDTLEVAGFLAVEPEFQPAPLEQLASAYGAAWRWLRQDFKDDTHLLSIFDEGRGNFGYIRRDREWQQTTGFLGKLANAHVQLLAGARSARLSRAPNVPTLPPVARFEFFRTGARQAGVWLVRQGHVRFALPITTATRPGVADYLPAPHGLPGFAAPVEQLVAALTPFLELDDGRTVVAADGADAIEPAPDGRGVRACWTRWAQLGAKPGELVDPGLDADVEWRLEGTRLTRVERLTARRPVAIRRWRVIVPSTGTRWLTYTAGTVRTDVLDGPEGVLEVSVPQADWPYGTSRTSTSGSTPNGRGARMAIPQHLIFAAENIQLPAGETKSWTVRLEVRSGHSQ